MKLNNIHGAFKLSKYFRYIVSEHVCDKGVMWHALIGNSLLASKKVIDYICALDGKVFYLDKITLPHKIKQELINGLYFVSDSVSEETSIFKLYKPSKPSVKHLRLCISNNCNMSCSYCYVKNQEEATQMPYDIAKKAILEYLKILKSAKEHGNITFFGGEPFLNWETFRRTVLLIRQIDSQSHFIKNISVVTNGTLINSKRAAFLRDNNIGVSISFDGPKNINDKVRLIKEGGGSYHSIIKGLQKLIDSNYKPSSLVCTIGNHNIEALREVVSFAHARQISLNINHAFAEPKHLIYKFDDNKLIKSLLEVSAFGCNCGANFDGTWQWAYNRLFSNKRYLRHCAASGGEFSIDSGGNVKPCPGFDVKYGSIDNVNEVLNSETYNYFWNRAAPNLPDCKGCEIEGLCGGGCMLNASKNHDGDIYRACDSCNVFKEVFRCLVMRYLENKVKK